MADNRLLEMGDPGMTSMDVLFGNKGDSAETARMLAESQTQIAGEQWNMYKQVFAPYEAELVAAHRTIIPEQLGLDLARIRAQEADVSGRMGINEELRQQQMRSLQRSEPVEQAFYEEALQGISIEDRMNAAGADVQQAYDATKPQMQRDMSRMGLRPDSGRFTDAMAKMSYNRARDIAFARTNARRLGQAENLGRLSTAMSARGNIAGLTAQTGPSATNPLGQGMVGAGLQKAGQSLQGFAGASASNQAAAQIQAGQTQSALSGADALLAVL